MEYIVIFPDDDDDDDAVPCYWFHLALIEFHHNVPGYRTADQKGVRWCHNACAIRR
jgi:hypothetical protein